MEKIDFADLLCSCIYTHKGPFLYYSLRLKRMYVCKKKKGCMKPTVNCCTSLLNGLHMPSPQEHDKVR